LGSVQNFRHETAEVSETSAVYLKLWTHPTFAIPINLCYSVDMKRIEGYLLIPHELLHVLAHRLINKRCQYRVGDRCVKPTEPLSFKEELFTLVLPFAVFLLVALGLTIIIPFIAKYKNLFWIFSLFTILQMSLLYLFTTLIDVRKAYLLIRNKPWQTWTPFDIFFWPAVSWDEIRKRRRQSKEQQSSESIIVLGRQF
jgi:hypothetical protein